jgi:hypothetical protein
MGTKRKKLGMRFASQLMRAREELARLGGDSEPCRFVQRVKILFDAAGDILLDAVAPGQFGPARFFDQAARLIVAGEGLGQNLPAASLANWPRGTGMATAENPNWSGRSALEVIWHICHTVGEAVAFGRGMAGLARIAINDWCVEDLRVEPAEPAALLWRHTTRLQLRGPMTLLDNWRPQRLRAELRRVQLSLEDEYKKWTRKKLSQGEAEPEAARTKSRKGKYDNSVLQAIPLNGSRSFARLSEKTGLPNSTLNNTLKRLRRHELVRQRTPRGPWERTTLGAK